VAKVLEVRAAKNEDIARRPYYGVPGDHVFLEVQGFVNGKVIRASWLWPDWHSAGRIVRLEPCQIPMEARKALNSPYPSTPDLLPSMQDMEREQHDLQLRLVQIDGEMERANPDPMKHTPVRPGQAQKETKGH